MFKKIPQPVREIIAKLNEANFEAFIVGGCVRDLLLKKEPQDWDIATNAQPEEIQKIFSESFYENKFGTVGVKVEPFFPLLDTEIKILRKQKEAALEIAKEYLKKIGCPVHGREHTEKVVFLIKKIAKHYPQANADLLEIAGYFHDTGRSKYSDHRHDAESQLIITASLKNIFDKDTLGLILIIAKHNKNDASQCIEQEILKEADIIEGIGEWRLKKALTEKPSHIDWIKNDYQKLINKIVLSPAIILLNESIKKANHLLGISLQLNDSPKKDVVEVTTYRIESKYSDKRHPDQVRFAKTLAEDLSRRDFTINSLAMRLHDNQLEIIDLFTGQKDLKNKIIRAVGDAQERFSEDALRMMRAVRFAAQLNFTIEPKTLKAISQNSANLKHISQERIHDELVKIIHSSHPSEGVETSRETGLLKFILPELEKGVGVKQNLHHIYTIYQHCLLSLKFCPSEKLTVRLAALLHDIAKPQTKRGEGLYATFYNHDHAGARMAEKILERLRFSREIIAKVRLLIDNHMFYYNPDEVTESSVRRLIQKVGLENTQDLINLRIADRLGSGTPKAKPYKLRHLEYIIEKVSTDAVSVKKLKVNGNDLIKNLTIPPGPKIGAILDVLLFEVIEDPEKNKKEILLKRAKILNQENLENLRKNAKIKIEEKKEEDDQEIKKKYWVK